MELTPKLSICFGTYNRLEYLKLTLANIMDQLKGIQFEIVIADGGSTDGTLDYFKEIKKKYDNFCLIEHGNLIGSAKTMQDCLSRARGEYIFMSSDHTLINGESFIANIKYLDNTPDISVILLKNYVPNSRRFPYAINHGTIPHIVAGDMSLWRAKEIHNIVIDTNYKKHFWPIDMVLSSIFAGKCIVHEKNKSNIHIKITHEDDMHTNTMINKYSKLDRIYFQNKWRDRVNKINADASKLDLIRVKLACKLMSFFSRTINSRYFSGILILLQKFVNNNNWLLMEILKHDHNNNFKNIDAIKLYFNLPFIEDIVDWFYNRTSIIRNDHIIQNKDYFLYQQIRVRK